MNKRMVFVVLMLAVLAGLGIALFFLSSNPPADSAAVSRAAPEAAYVYDAGGVESLAVRSGSGEYTLSGGDNPSLLGFEDVPLDTYSLNRVLAAASRLVSRGLVSAGAADLAVFGLEAPRAECVVRSRGGTAVTLLIGSAAPDGSNVYVKLAETPEIHLAASYETGVFLRGPLDFADTEISPPAAERGGGEFPFEKIILGGQVRRGEAVTIMNVGNSPGIGGSPFLITEPVNAALSADRGLPPLEALFGLRAGRVAARLSDTDAPGRYGLAEPWSTAEVSGGALEFRLSVSKPDNGGMVFVRRDGSPLIYETAASALPWLELSWFDLMEKLIILPFIDTVASVEIKTPERQVSFFLSGERDELRVSAGGADMDVKNFRSYYQTLIGAGYDEKSGVSVSALPPPFLEITYRYREGGKSADTVSFHHASSRRVLASLNRGRPYFTLSAYTGKVLADLDLVLAGERVRPYL
jgi:hypothetical protein